MGSVAKQALRGKQHDAGGEQVLSFAARPSLRS